MSRKRVTLKDVAQEVGVSINTISCVLNPRDPGNVKVSPATRAAIVKAARKLGYRRNAAAASLVGCRTRTLGILMESIISPFNAAIVDAFEEMAAGLGYHCFVGCTRYHGLQKLDYVEQFLSHGVDGVLLTTIWNDPEVEHALKTVLRQELPLVFIDYMWEKRPAPLICGNHFMGGQLLANHLLQMGHRNLAFLCNIGQQNSRSIKERIRGVQDVLKKGGSRGLHLDLLWSPTHDAEDFAQTVMQRLRSPGAPTAILCSGDLTAMELFIGLRKYGIEVPRDLAITGFDDLLTPYVEGNLHLDGHTWPWQFPITTVRQPLKRIGEKAAEVLIGQIEAGTAARGEEYLLDVELVIGESTRKGAGRSNASVHWEPSSKGRTTRGTKPGGKTRS